MSDEFYEGADRLEEAPTDPRTGAKLPRGMLVDEFNYPRSDKEIASELKERLQDAGLSLDREQREAHDEAAYNRARDEAVERAVRGHAQGNQQNLQQNVTEEQQIAQSWQGVQTYAAGLQHAYAQHAKALNDVNDSDLKRTDPDAFADRRAQLRDWRNRLDHESQRLGYAANQVKTAAAQHQQAAQMNYLKEQRKELLFRIPEWADSERAARESTAVSKWAAQKYGVGEGELSDMTDAKSIALIVDAWRQETGGMQRSLAKQKMLDKLAAYSKSGKPPQTAKEIMQATREEMHSRNVRDDTRIAAKALRRLLGDRL